MARPRKSPRALRRKLDTRVNPDLYAWLESQVGLGKRYRSKAHAIDEAILALREKLEGC